MLFGSQYGVAQLFTLACASLCFGSFLWGALFLFKRPASRPAAMTIVSAFILATILCQLAAILGFYDHDPVRFAVALLLYALGFALFWSAVRAVRGHAMAYAFTQEHPRALIRKGPFARVRHPFYTAYVTAWLAGWIGTGQWWLLAPTAATASLLLRAANGEEAAFLASPLADEYRYYQHVTGRFLPRLRRSP